jgi:DNA-binding transcriptional regulator YiaG
MKKLKGNYIGGYSLKEFKEDLKAFDLETQGIHTGKFRKSIVVLPAKPDEVKAARKALHVTQQDFANVIGVSLPTVKAWERGARQPDGVASKLIRLLRKQTKFANIWASI